jgi:hypothetical protein
VETGRKRGKEVLERKMLRIGEARETGIRITGGISEVGSRPRALRPSFRPQLGSGSNHQIFYSQKKIHQHSFLNI